MKVKAEEKKRSSPAEVKVETKQEKETHERIAFSVTNLSLLELRLGGLRLLGPPGYAYGRSNNIINGSYLLLSIIFELV